MRQSADVSQLRMGALIRCNQLHPRRRLMSCDAIKGGSCVRNKRNEQCVAAMRMPCSTCTGTASSMHRMLGHCITPATIGARYNSICAAWRPGHHAAHIWRPHPLYVGVHAGCVWHLEGATQCRLLSCSTAAYKRWVKRHAGGGNVMTAHHLSV